jgi:hypothetical protein
MNLMLYQLKLVHTHIFSFSTPLLSCRSSVFILIPSTKKVAILISSSYVFSNIMQSFLVSVIRATPPTHHIILDFNTLVWLVKKHILRNSSLCHLLYLLSFPRSWLQVFPQHRILKYPQRAVVLLM